ncbi:MAG: UDP-N-acetylmuramoyl-tripeptide--D-alanyl-D-alanine ligase, partial [Lachnospiraceae bacterium]|nr:UDP-N-acetylmuramoyl-tripeptide--D-alanyl-D-alanine ligase [Lachnospiraceae bacterium]
MMDSSYGRFLIGLSVGLEAVFLFMGIYAIIYIGRFNAHMFQQNGYKINEQITWLKKNWKKQSVLFVWLGLSVVSYAVLRLIAPFPILYNVLLIVLYLLLFLLTGFIIYYYRFLKRFHNKRPLAFTARIKRMMITDGVLTGALITVLALVLSRLGMKVQGEVIGIPSYFGVLISIPLAGVFQLVAYMAACVINSPLDKAINRAYTKEALDMLNSNRSRLTVIGITGSYGKTSMKYYLEELLSVRFDVLITPGNFNTPLGVVRTIREHMTPRNEIFLCEMGARYVGDIKELCDMVEPDMGIIVSVGPQHLETFGGIENVISTKYELAEAVTRRSGKLFLNGDNSYMIDESKKYPEAVIYHASEKDEGYRATDIVTDSEGTSFTAVTPDGESARFETRLIGAHNVINVMGAIAVAHSLGISLKELLIPVRRLRAVPHRLEMRREQGVTIIDDAYNSNPVGSKAAVECLGGMKGVRIMVTPGMVELGDKEDDYNYEFGRTAAAFCDYVALVGRRHTEPIYKGLIDAGFDESRVRTFVRLEEALQYAYGIKDHGEK